MNGAFVELIKIEFAGGSTIKDAIGKARDIADQYDTTVVFDFNSVEMAISPKSKANTFEIIDMYNAELNRKRRVEV